MMNESKEILRVRVRRKENSAEKLNYEKKKQLKFFYNRMERRSS